MKKSSWPLLLVALIFFSGYITSHAAAAEPGNQEFLSSLVSTDDKLVKIITALMASNQVLSCDLDMTLLGKSYRQFHDLSEQYIDRENDHMDKFVEYTELLVNSETFQQHTATTKTCEELLTIYGEVLKQINESSKRILDSQQ